MTQKVNIEILGPHLGKSAVCMPVLRALPDWFGIEEALVHYEAEIEKLPTFLACHADDVVGFISLKLHNPYVAEVYVMGILPEMHRRGIGRELMAQSFAWLREQQLEYVQVKTLAASHPDKGYAKTRAFYASVGFRPLEEFDRIWDEQNPCLIMIRKL
jgi:GNAT superfamily N-acetyltransferase